MSDSNEKITAPRPTGAGLMGGGGRGGMRGAVEKPKDFWGTARRLLGYLRPQRVKLILVVILAVGSTAEDAGTNLAPGQDPGHAVTRQYALHQTTEGRFPDAPLDLGAFERCGASSSCGVVFADGYESGGTSAWTLAVP